MGTMTIGMDIAKRIFYLHGEDECGRTAMHKKISREKLVPFIANLPASVIAMEAGCGAHHWARRFSQLGHEGLFKLSMQRSLTPQASEAP